METIDVPYVAIPNTTKKIVYSGGREYHLFISVPLTPPPEAGFPVIYLLDANSVFGTMTEAIRAQSSFPERTGVEPGIVVGIGYPTESPFHPARHYDFTFPVPQTELPAHPEGSEWPEQGGNAAFLSFLAHECKPLVEREYPINPDRQAIFGHSLGGLFVLTALFTQPYQFQTYIAGSPSIHWNERILLEKERAFSALLTEQDKPIRLLIGLGELETRQGTWGSKKAEQMATRLSSSIDTEKLSVEYMEFPGEHHVSVLPALISRAIRFALKP